MLADLLPTWVVAVEATDRTSPAPLLAEEAVALGSAVPKRSLEFTIGRHCAHEALRGLGADRGPILIGPAREPLWPGDVVGSITHCPGFAAAAVARRTDAASIGIDAEPNEVLPAEVLPDVATEEERRALHALGSTGVCWDRVLFSAKESVFKAWYPIAARWLGFTDVRLAIQPDVTDGAGGTFTADLLGQRLDVDGQAMTCMCGRYAVTDERVLTALVLRAGATRAAGPA